MFAEVLKMLRFGNMISRFHNLTDFHPKLVCLNKSTIGGGDDAKSGWDWQPGLDQRSQVGTLATGNGQTGPV